MTSNQALETSNQAMEGRAAVLIAAVLGGLAVAAGAFGAHGLQATLAESGHAETWQTAVRYQMWHALALLGATALARRNGGIGIVLATFSAGTILFSGTLYAIALGGPRWLGAVTPIGGVLLVVGWVALGRAALGWAALATGTRR